MRFEGGSSKVIQGRAKLMRHPSTDTTGFEFAYLDITGITWKGLLSILVEMSRDRV